MNRSTMLGGIMAFMLAVSLPLITGGQVYSSGTSAAPAAKSIVLPLKATDAFVPTWPVAEVAKARHDDRAAAAAQTQPGSTPSAPSAGEAVGGQSTAAPSTGSARSATAPAPAPASAPAPVPVPAPAPVAAPACPANVGGSTAGAPGRVSGDGVLGTTSADLASFASAYNAIRVANCLAPIPMSNIRYNSCLEDRLFWIAGDPSTDVASAWGHAGTVTRSDGVPEYGCDGNLAGGSNNTGAVVAQKWWDSLAHRDSLYRPGTSIAGICINFAMVHGGVNDPANFARASARWVRC